jgi:hypothetical protein
MSLSVHVAVLALLPVTPATLAAPTPDAGGEEEIRKAAEAALEAIHNQNWKALAANISTEDLERFKAAVTPALKHAAAQPLDKDGLPEPRDQIILGMLGGADPKELLALPPKEFFAAFVEVALPEGQKQLFVGMDARVVGTAREGRDLVHVLYRAKGKVSFGEGLDQPAKGPAKKTEMVGEMTRMGVLTLKRGGGGWKVLVPDELQYVPYFLNAEWKEKK